MAGEWLRKEAHLPSLSLTKKRALVKTMPRRLGFWLFTLTRTGKSGVSKERKFNISSVLTTRVVDRRFEVVFQARMLPSIN
jgi:hypothetical protein